MKALTLVLLAIIIVVVLVACGPSEEELDATATSEAAALYAQQTADAPTATPTIEPSPTATATPEPTATPQPSPTPALPPAEEILEPAMTALEAAKSYHMNMALLAALDFSGLAVEMDILFDGDILAPDSLSGSYELTLLGQSTAFDLILLGDEAYMREPGSEQWVAIPADEAAISPGGYTTFDMDKLSDLTLVGEESLDGQPVYHIQGKMSDLGEFMGTLNLSELEQLGQNIEISGELGVEYWIGVDDGLVKQVRTAGDLIMSGDFDGLGPGELNMNLDMEVAFSDFGKELFIEAPDVAPPADAEPAAAAECAAEDVLCFGLVTQAGKLYDYNYNQSAWEGVVSAGREVDAVVEYIETVDPGDYTANIQQFIDAGYDVIVTVSFEPAEATYDLAAQYPDIQFIGVDQGHEPDFDNLTGLVFEEYNGGFLAGALAGLITESNQVAGVYGSEIIPAVVDFKEGFEAGAQYTNPEVAVISTFHPGGLDVAFNDPEWGAATAQAAITDGADVIFGAGGNTGIGALYKAVESEGVYCLGVDSDQWFTVLEAQSCLVSSAIKDISPGVKEAILLAVAGLLPPGNHYAPMGLAPYHDFDDLLSQEVKVELAGLAEVITNDQRYDPAE